MYERVSSAEPTVDHQRTQAETVGFVFDEVVVDDGVSGVTTKLAHRLDGRRLFDRLRAGDTLMVRCVDRLGRNYEDEADNIRASMRRGVVIWTIINGITFDGATKDPMQQAVRDALIGFMAVLSHTQQRPKRRLRGRYRARQGNPESPETQNQSGAQAQLYRGQDCTSDSNGRQRQSCHSGRKARRILTDGRIPNPRKARPMHTKTFRSGLEPCSPQATAAASDECWVTRE